MKEKYLGSAEDQRFVADYLGLMRLTVPYEMFTTPSTQSLAEIRSSLASSVDIDLFLEITQKCCEVIRNEYSAEFELIPDTRYFIGNVDGNDLGGFHSRHAVGYHNVFKAGFAIPLSESEFKNRVLRTVELARNYLHDSVHHSTFCSFRRLVRRPLRPSDAKKTMPEVYREQYGVNFRNAAGVSYSSAKLTHKVPAAINLNLLMDGVGIEVIASAMNRLQLPKLVSPKSPMEKSVLNEVLLQIPEDKPADWGQEFYFEVVRPTRRFLSHWGGEPFRALVLQAMLSGELSELKGYFDERFGEINAWEKIFRQPSFELAESQ